MADFTYGVTLTVRRPTGARFGVTTYGPDHTIERCALAPSGSTEVVNGQATVVDKDTVYAPYDADVAARDEIVVPAGQPIDAGTYQVDGSPGRYRNPFTGEEAGCVIRLTRATG